MCAICMYHGIFRLVMWAKISGNDHGDCDWLISDDKIIMRERSDSVVECLARDRGAAGSSLVGVTALRP